MFANQMIFNILLVFPPTCNTTLRTVTPDPFHEASDLWNDDGCSLSVLLLSYKLDASS